MATEAPGEHQVTDPHAVETLIGDLDDLADESASEATEVEINETKGLLSHAGHRGLLDSGVRRLDVNDAAEAFIGSVIFASPLLVEDGVFDIATYLFQTTVFGLPVFLILNTGFVIFLTYALLEWTGRDKEESHHVFRVIPMRLLMILGVSFVVAAILMTLWGRTGSWQQPGEALARVTVLWTVGSIGAALGDILSANDTGIPQTETAPSAVPEIDVGQLRDEVDITDMSDGQLLSTLYEQFDELESTIQSGSERRMINRLRERTEQSTEQSLFGESISKYTSRDIAEAFVGSVFFSIPFLVEDGVFDVGSFFLSIRIGQIPLYLLLNVVFVLTIVWMLVYWTGPQRVEVTRPLFGFIPRRLVGITLVSFLTAAALMTMWGRVGEFQDPLMAIGRITAVWTVAAFGAALGDILPGESSGDDINDDISDLTELIGER